MATRVRNIHTHAGSDRDRARMLVSGSQTMTEALHGAALLSATRVALPRPELARHFTWSQSAIPEDKESTMTESVDLFLDRITRANSVDIYKARHMTDAETPYHMRTPGMVLKQSPRRITRAFDRAGIYNPHREPLAATLPDLQIVHDFKAFVEARGQQMPRVLEEAPVEIAPPPPMEIRKEARRALFDDPLYKGLKRRP